MHQLTTYQSFVLYETRAKHYLVATDNVGSNARILKFDRSDNSRNGPLSVQEDGSALTCDQVEKLKQTLRGAGASELVRAVGVIGFVQFLEGWYVLFCTKRREIGVVGRHIIYKIVETAFVSLSTNKTADYSVLKTDEDR